jgi:hypothetical protein
VVTAGDLVPLDDRFNLDGFDATLGTLTSATVSISTHVQMRVRSHDGGIGLAATVRLRSTLSSRYTSVKRQSGWPSMGTVDVSARTSPFHAALVL